MARGLLIAGDGLCFLKAVQTMRDFLLKETDVRDVTVVRTAYLSFQEFQSQIVAALYASQNEPLLILFCGHGGRARKASGPKNPRKKNAGWQLSSDQEVVSYYEFACLLRGHPAPVYIMNDCCFAFGIVKELRRAGLSKKKVGVLVSSAGNRYTYTGEFVDLVLQHWRMSRPLRTGNAIIVREGVRPVKTVRWREKIGDFFMKRIMDLVPKYLFFKIFGGPVTLHEDEAVWLYTKNKKETLPEKRWGVVFDYHFFPTRALEGGTVCISGAEAVGK